MCWLMKIVLLIISAISRLMPITHRCNRDRLPSVLFGYGLVLNSGFISRFDLVFIQLSRFPLICPIEIIEQI